MKKLTTILAAVAMIISTSAFANAGVNVTQKVSEAFKSNFTGATNVTWSQTNDFYFAHFELNNNDVVVVYSEDGEMVGTSQLINKSALPQPINNYLKDQYGDFTISPSVTKVDLDDKTSYFITLENKTSIVRLRCSENGALAVESKTKKPVLVGKVY